MDPELDNGNENLDTGADAGQNQAAAPEYVTAADFQEFQRGITESIQGLQAPAQQAQTPEQSAEPQEPKQPNLKDYDFKNDESAFAKYQKDYYNFHRHEEKQADAVTAKADEAKQADKDLKSAHDKRMTDYAKENPAFSETMKTAGAIQVFDEVKKAVWGHPQSPQVIEYLAKNPKEVETLNMALESGGVQAVAFQIGALGQQIKAQNVEGQANITAAGQKPPRIFNKGGASNGGANMSREQRFARFHGHDK